MTREEEIVQAAKEYEQSTTFGDIVLSKLSRGVNSACGIGFLEGAVWADNHLWKPADGDDLPEIDREVIALIEAFGHYKVIFAHRVDENAEIHTSIDGKPLVLHPKKHGEGGWNIPDIKFWLDCELPKMEE